MYQPIETMPKGKPCFVRQMCADHPKFGRISVCSKVKGKIVKANGEELDNIGGMGKFNAPHEWAPCHSENALKAAGWI